MPVFILYLLKLSISLSVVWVFYQLLLRRLTFYNWNRWYLLGYSLLSFGIPLINIGPIGEEDPGRQPFVIQYIPSIASYGPAPAAAVSPSFSWTVWDGLLLIFAGGVCFGLVRFVFRWVSLYRIRRQAKLLPDAGMPKQAGLGEEGGIRIYQVDEDIIPFSFGNAVYINQHLHTEKEWEEIILHEYIHIKQKHTVDILLAELLCAFSWYNPFAWMIRHSIRQNLEFIADRQVLRQGYDKKDYQYHLLKVVGQSRYRLASNFNFSSLKKRIIMMNSLGSASLQLVKFLFVVPLVGVLLVAFRDRYGDLFPRSSSVAYVNAAGGGAGASAVGTRVAATGTGASAAGTTGRAAAAGGVTAMGGSGVRGGVVVTGRPAAAGTNVGRATADTTPGLKLVEPSPGSFTAKPIGGPTTPGKITIQALPPGVLYVVDGKAMPDDWNSSSLLPSDIHSIDVLKGDAAFRLFGERGAAHGVVAITTTSYWGSTHGELFVPENRMHSDPLVLVNGVELRADDIYRIAPDNIERITVLKNDSSIHAYGAYGPRAKNGVVLIDLKPGRTVPLYDSGGLIRPRFTLQPVGGSR